MTTMAWRSLTHQFARPDSGRDEVGDDVLSTAPVAQPLNEWMTRVAHRVADAALSKKRNTGREDPNGDIHPPRHDTCGLTELTVINQYLI